MRAAAQEVAMGFGYNLGWGKGMDPKVNAQRGARSETFSQGTERRRG